MLLISPSVGAAKTVGFGTGKPGASIDASEYARARGLDRDDAGVRDDLHPGWLTLTDDELVLHYPGMRGLRPGPVGVIDRMPRDGVGLTWFDQTVKALTSRVLHLEFADGSQLLTATAYTTLSRRKPFDDEADLFVEAFGDAAEHVRPD